MILLSARDDSSVIQRFIAEIFSTLQNLPNDTPDLCEMVLLREPTITLDAIKPHISSVNDKSIYRSHFTFLGYTFRTSLAKICALVDFMDGLGDANYQNSLSQGMYFINLDVTKHKLYSPAYMPLIQRSCDILTQSNRCKVEPYLTLCTIADSIIERCVWAQFAEDRMSYTVSRNIMDTILRKLFSFSLNISTSSSDIKKVEVKRYSKVPSWLLIKSFTKVTSFGAMAQFIAATSSSINYYTERLNLYGNGAEEDNASMEKNLVEEKQVLPESLELPEDLHPVINENTDAAIDAFIQTCDNIDELFIYVTKEFECSTVSMNFAFSIILDVPIIPQLWDKDTSKAEFFAYSVSILCTLLDKPFIIDTLLLFFMFTLARHYSCMDSFDLLLFSLWYSKQPDKGSNIIFSLTDFEATPSSVLDPPKNWSFLSGPVKKDLNFYVFVLHLLFLEVLSLENKGIVPSTFLSVYSGYIQRNLISSYCQNSTFSTVLLNFISDYCDKIKNLPPFLRFSSSEEVLTSTGNKVITLLQDSIADLFIAIPYAMGSLFMKQGFRSVKKLIIDELITLSDCRKQLIVSRTSFIPALLYIFDTLVVEPLCEPGHSKTCVFIANSYLHSLIRSGYLLDICLIRLLFPQLELGATEPVGFLRYRSIETLLNLQDIDLLSFYLNECTGSELLPLVQKLHVHLNITFILSYRTFREGPTFCNSFLEVLNRSLEMRGAGGKGLLIPYEILLTIYEFAYTLPWMHTVKEARAIAGLFPMTYKPFKETQPLVASLGSHLSTIPVPEILNHLHRISSHITYGAILSSSHYKKVSNDFIYCLITQGADPIFLVAMLVTNCMTREVKSRILFSESAFAAAARGDKPPTSKSIYEGRKSNSAIIQKFTLASTPSETTTPFKEAKDSPKALEITSSRLGKASIVGSVRYAEAYGGFDKVEPMGYFNNYLCVIQVLRDLMLLLIDETKREHHDKVLLAIKLIVADCRLILSPLPAMNSMLFEGGGIDAGIHSWFITMIYLSLYQSVKLFSIKQKSLLEEAIKLLQQLETDQNTLLSLPLPVQSLQTDLSEFDCLDSDKLARVIEPLQEIVNTQLWLLHTQSLPTLKNPFSNIFTGQTGALADKLGTLQTIQDKAAHKLADIDNHIRQCQEQMAAVQLSNDQAQINRLRVYLATLEQKKDTLTIHHSTCYINVTKFQQDLQVSGSLMSVIHLIKAREITLQLSKILTALKTILYKAKQLEEDKKRVYNWFLGDDGIFSGPFTCNLLWLRNHIKAVYHYVLQGNKQVQSAGIHNSIELPLSLEGLEAANKVRLEELNEDGFYERQFLHARYYTQLECLCSKDSPEQLIRTYENAFETCHTKCSGLQFYRKYADSFMYKHSFFSILNQESSIFTLSIRSTVPSAKFEHLLTEFTNFFTLSTSSQVGIEFMTETYAFINPLWMLAQLTLDTVEKIEHSEDSVPTILFLHGALSKASEMYEKPLNDFLATTQHLFHDLTSSNQARMSELSQYCTTFNEYYTFRQVNTFSNPGYLGSLASGRVPYFYSRPVLIVHAISTIDEKTSTDEKSSSTRRNETPKNTQHAISFCNFCHYYTQTTLLPMIYSLMPRYLFIHRVLQQYAGNKGHKSISKLPLLLMKPLDQDVQNSGLQLTDTDALPFMGSRSYSKIASRCKAFGMFCGRVFAYRLPLKQCFDPEMLLLLGITSFSGMLLLDIITFCVYLALSMHEASPAVQVGALTTYSILFQFLNLLLSKDILNNRLLNVTRNNILLICNTLKLAPQVAETVHDSLNLSTAPRVLCYFLYEQLPQELKEIVNELLAQGTESLVAELRENYKSIFMRIENSIQLIPELQTRIAMETLLDHPLSTLRARVDKVMHILFIGEKVFSTNPNVQAVFMEELKKATNNFITDACLSLNFDTEQLYSFIYRAIRELPLVSSLPCEGLSIAKKLTPQKGPGAGKKLRNTNNHSNPSHNPSRRGGNARKNNAHTVDGVPPLVQDSPPP